MRKWMLVILVGILLSFCIGCSKNAADDEVREYKFEENGEWMEIVFDNVHLRIEKTCFEEKTMNDSAFKLEEAITVASSFLGDYASRDEVMCYMHDGEGMTAVYDKEIHIYYPQQRNIPYIMLVTQALAGAEGVPDWLFVGLGAYAADQNGDSLLDTWASTIDVYETLPRESEEGIAIDYPLNELAKLLKEAAVYTEASALGDMIEGILQYEDPQQSYEYRGAYAVYAGSFISYLEKQYGFDNVMQIYQGGDMVEILGLDKDTLLNEWNQSLV